MNSSLNPGPRNRARNALDILQIEAWADRFPERLQQLWEGIRFFAKAVEQSDDDHLPAATHSFLYAVGNFKRQSPVVPTARPAEVFRNPWEARSEVELGGTESNALFPLLPRLEHHPNRWNVPGSS